MSTTKLDAEGLARKAHPDWGVYGLNGYAAAIREHSQPLSDELAQVKAERDEMRKALDAIANNGMDARQCMEAARAILEKYPKP